MMFKKVLLLDSGILGMGMVGNVCSNMFAFITP